MADDEADYLDLEQFSSIDHALEVLSNSRSYEAPLAAVIGPEQYLDLQTVFALSACSRFRGLHEGVVREVRAANPHAAFPLNRAFAETVLVVAYADDHPDSVQRLTDARAKQPKELRRLSVSELIDHIEPDAPGFRRVYDELCEITHFGSVAFWQPHAVDDDFVYRWRSEPHWSDEGQALIACAQLKEMSGAAVTYRGRFVRHHLAA